MLLERVSEVFALLTLQCALTSTSLRDT